MPGSLPKRHVPFTNKTALMTSQRRKDEPTLIQRYVIVARLLTKLLWTRGRQSPLLQLEGDT